MSNLVCPFCNSELHKDSDGYYTCYTDNCECMKYGGNGASGSESLWLALIRTRKALDVAVDALKVIGSGQIIEHSVLFHEDDNKITIANKALEQITALEQKDVK